MPRKYQRKLGSRSYMDYPQATIEKALEKITEGWSIRRASSVFKIPFGTLRNKFNGVRIRTSGGQTVFTPAEENSFIRAANCCGEWGFPLTITDLRYLAKNYLDNQGRTINKFKSNMPGIDWVRSLLERHKQQISQKLATNIKRSRANVSRDTIKEYFNNLRETLQDVPDSHIFNYDETNLQDDPGKQKMLFRRGTKYPERICNFTKTAISVMMCGSASGVLLPPYIIYKAEKMWQQWTEMGPKGEPCCKERCCCAGARYNRTHHGWMDAQTFTDWFEASFLPHAKRLPGKKVLIGDNLSSHFTESVLRQCQENYIAFVCLPKNSTHLTQPLDVGFFRSLKISWREVLTKWKKTHIQQTAIDKKDFPQLLASTLLNMNIKSESAIKKDLVSSFEATGIFPMNPEQVLQKIPEEEQDVNADGSVQNVLVNYLQQQRFTAAPSRRNIKRQKLSVEPGKSVVANNGDDDDSDSDIAEPLTNDDSDEDPQDETDDVQAETEYLEPEINDIAVGAFLLVKVYGGLRKKTAYRYAAMVQNILVNGEGKKEFELLGLKSLEKSKKKFKIQEGDEFIADMSDVIAILPNPAVQDSIDGRSAYLFEKVVDVFEII